MCDGDDNDCDGVADESGATGEGTWYADADGDGFGDLTAPVRSGAVPSGYLADASDCDDTDPAINELATKVCDGADNDCDEEVDETGAADEPTWYADTDGDGYGTASRTATACAAPSGHVAEGGDCNDLDDECDGRVDADAVDTSEWYPDGDGDGYTLGDGAVRECDQPPGMSALSSPLDCDDEDGAIYPGAPELAGDDVDQDCDGADTELEDTGPDDKDQVRDIPDRTDTGAATATGCAHSSRPPGLGWFLGLLAALSLRRAR